ncbi:glycosyltransferase family 2 protein [Clostridium tarantellae]|uniref:Glycosyltransferase n=1 Tax=Clostridium tarantellae TaxID=39493 RepID=A0A6I1MS03_9CLOT|nr:glycosyltransferase family 2 protein [Clostridium tarantellae]MPQ43059.1 glycosyltransferase [Clostridium tarantellae]
MTLISVIIPVYNVEKYLQQCVESVLNQSFKNIEVILINDGSTDNSKKICNEYELKDSRVKVIHKKNKGLSHTRNVGIKASKGDYLLFLDSDDYWVSNSLAAIEKYTKYGVDVVFLTSAKFFEKDNLLEKNFECLNKYEINNKTQEEVLKYLANIEKFPGSACTKLVKKSLIIEKKIFFQKGLLSEDIDWSTKLLIEAKSFYVCNVNFYIYRKQRQGSITNRISYKNVKDLLFIIKKWSEKCEKGEVAINLKPYILAIYSYEYIVLIGLIFFLPKNTRKLFYKDINKLRVLLKYGKTKKVKIVKLVVKVLGVVPTAYILNKYINISSK